MSTTFFKTFFNLISKLSARFATQTILSTSGRFVNNQFKLDFPEQTGTISQKGKALKSNRDHFASHYLT